MNSVNRPQASQNYLTVMYDPDVRPVTTYPSKLCVYLAKKFQLCAGMKVLDIGCGRGEYLKGFEELGLVASGVDSSARAGHLAPNSSVHQVDIENESLPFSESTFDVVFSKSVLEHLENPISLLEDQFRVLKPGGVLINLTPSWEFQYRIFFDDFTHKSPFTRKSLGMATKATNFEAVEAVYFRQLPLLWSIGGLLPLAEVTRLLAPTRLGSHIKWVRFSKEIMLLCFARKPGAAAQSSQ